jgi:hypothetical protein
MITLVLSVDSNRGSGQQNRQGANHRFEFQTGVATRKSKISRLNEFTNRNCIDGVMLMVIDEHEHEQRKAHRSSDRRQQAAPM